METRRRSSLQTGRGTTGEQEVAEVNYKDITCIQDDWDVEEFVSKTCTGMFLYHPAFKILLATFIIVNAITVAMRTERELEEKYFGFFTAVDTIVLSFLLCEVVLNWYYGFLLYWKDGWNIINFFIVVSLFIGFLIPNLNFKTFFHMVRVMRLVQVCTLVGGLARMIQVILQSAPDMANIMILLFAIMLVFSVFGVTLFGSLVPKHFGNLGTALYTLFICITQDGWINIYDDFEKEGLALEIGGALYFFIFITFGAFIFANLLVAVVTTNLEQSMTEYNEERQMRARSPFASAYLGLDDDTDDDYFMGPTEPVHMKEVMHGTPMIHRQELLSCGNLGSLNEASCEELCVVLEAIHENLKEYRVIRDELDQIVEEVRSIRFNIEQEQEVVLRNIRGASMSETVLGTEVMQGKPGDVITALMSLEKSNVIETEYQKGAIKTAALRARRQSMAAGSMDEKLQEDMPAETSPENTQRHHRPSLGGEDSEKVQRHPESSGRGHGERNQKHLDGKGGGHAERSQKHQDSKGGASAEKHQRHQESTSGRGSERVQRHPESLQPTGKSGE